MRYIYLVLFLLLSSSIVFGQIASVQDGDWDDPNTWDCTCVPDFNDATITIAHNVTVIADVTIDETFVTTGGSLTINSGIIVTLNEDFVSSPLTIETGRTLTVFGTLEGSGLIISSIVVNGNIVNTGVISSPDPSLMTFSSGSSYTHSHATGGDIPLATWDAASNLLVNGMSNANPAPPNNLNQSFGNFTWNCLTQGATGGPAVFNLGGQLTSVQGTLTFQFSNNRPIRFNNNAGAGYNLTIGVDFINLGCPLILTSTSTSATTVTVTRDFTQSGGSFTFRAANTFDARLEVGRNFSKTVGAFAGGSGVGGISTLAFNGGVAQSYILAGTNPATINLEVINNSTLNMGTSFFTGTGNFSLASGSTLGVGATDALGAIQTGTVNGNIRVSGTRTFSSGSTVVYNGIAAQFMGSGHPSTSGVICQINNSSGVALAADITITGNLTLTSGNLSVLSRTLTLNGSFTPNSNFLNVTSSSSLVINGSGAFGTLTTTGSTTINSFTINRSSTGSVTLGSNLTISGTLTQTLGDITLNAFTLTIGGPYVRSNGSINADASASLIVNGTGALPAAITFAGAQALNTLTVNRASTTFPTSSSLTLSNLNLLAGTFDNSGTITMTNSGVLTRTEGSIINNTPTTSPTSNSYDIVYDIASDIVTGSEIPSLSNQLRNVTKTGGAQLTLSEDLTINGILTLTNGLFNASTRNVDLKGNLVANSTSTMTSSTFIFSGITSISGGSAIRFGNVSVTGSLTPTSNIRIDGNLVNDGTLVAGSGAQTVTFGGTTAISGLATSSFNNVTISGTLTAPTGNFNVAGTWTNNGTFTSVTPSNTVTFNGTSSIAGSAATNFSGIIISGILNAPTTLNVVGGFTNNGTFNRGTGTVVFNGSAVQSISGSAVTDFNNISVTNVGVPTSVRVQSNHNLRGTLTLASNSVFDADGSGNTSIFTLVSSDDDPTIDAAIATIPAGASVTGMVTVQRHMSIEPGPNANDRIYRFISSPVSAPAVSQIQSTLPVTGSFTGTSTCTGCGSTQSMFSYNETVITGDLNTGYIDFPANANSETLTTGRGYSLFIRGNVDPILSAGSALWSVRNTINSGTINFPVTFTSSGNAANDGWNLVGNPFPSTIDWNAASGWTKTNISGTIYITDNGDNPSVISTWNGVTGTNGGSRNIALGQGFWVQSSSASPVLTANESVKVGGTQTTFFREGGISDLLRITLAKGMASDETVVHFRDDATQDFDKQADAYKLKNSSVNLSTLLDTTKLAINSLPPLTCGTTIKLDLSEVVPGGYSLDFSEFESFSDKVLISLNDALENKTIDVRQQSSYLFSVSSEPATFGRNRFSVTFSYEKLGTLNTEHKEIICVGEGTSISVLNSDFNNVYSVVKNSQVISSGLEGNGSTLVFEIDSSTLIEGVNSLEIVSALKVCSSLSSSKGIQVTVENKPSVNAEAIERCNLGSVTLIASGGAQGNYRWYESDNDESIIEEASGSSFTTPELIKTKTYYVAAINSLGCEGKRIPVKAIINYPTEIMNVIGGSQCKNETVTLEALGGKDGEYRWYESTMAVNPVDGQYNSKFETPILAKNAIYYVSVFNEMGCEGIKVPVLASITTYDDAVIEVDGDKLISNHMDGNQWYLNGQLIPGAIGKEHELKESGVYRLEVKVGNCITSTEREMVITGLESLSGSRIKIYPNPVLNKVTIEVATSNKVFTEIINMLGASIVRKQLNSSESGVSRGEFDLSTESAGIYLIRIEEGETIYTYKIIKK